MERDFLGLGSKNVAVPLRDEFLDNSKNSALASGSRMQWSFSNKVSALPQLLSFKAAQDEKQRKTVVDPLLSNTDTSSFTHRHYVKSGAPEKKGGNQYAMTAYPFQISDAHSVHRSQEVKMFPISNQPKNVHPVALNIPVLQSQLVSSGLAVVGSSMNLQPFGGVPIATSVSVLPSTCSIVGTTDLRNASKSPGGLSQLTIFYAGSVSVYNDISPEKAQAIMLLAGSGLPQTQKNMLSTGPMQASFPSDAFKGLPVLGLSSPLSAAHLNGSHAGAGSCGNNELLTQSTKPIQASVSHANHSEPPKAVSAGSIAPTFISAAVPQARKASLARFLEKRKERINISPYSVAKKTPDCASATLDLMA